VQKIYGRCAAAQRIDIGVKFQLNSITGNKIA
jgi:hypothetical protein